MSFDDHGDKKCLRALTIVEVDINEKYCDNNKTCLIRVSRRGAKNVDGE